MPIDDAFIARRVRDSAAVIEGLARQSGAIASVARAVGECLQRGGAVLTCGNGGSAAEALHLSEELIGKFRSARRPFRALCLNADPTALTCIANDFGFHEVFARQVQGLARPGDALVVFSTSGASENVNRALAAARRAGVVTLGLLGKGGGAARPLCDHAVVVDDARTELIQEAHQVILHLILEEVESAG